MFRNSQSRIRFLLAMTVALGAVQCQKLPATSDPCAPNPCKAPQPTCTRLPQGAHACSKTLIDFDHDGHFSGIDDCDDYAAARHDGATEICDGIDNNCNDEVDEGFDVDGDGVTTCAGDCNDSEVDIHPQAEGYQDLCDGVDNDCDALTDEDYVGSSCALQAGVCAETTKACGTDGQEIECSAGRGYPADYGAEICDGRDNDCDGQTDEGVAVLAPPCPLQRGVCVEAVKQCGGEAGWLDCLADRGYPGIYQADETTCDREDNDCDGETDEAVTAQCCGDGVTDAGYGEQCDDENNNDFDDCRNSCKIPGCGDGLKNGSEECDDGNTFDEDTCSNECRDQLVLDGGLKNDMCAIGRINGTPVIRCWGSTAVIRSGQSGAGPRNLSVGSGQACAIFDEGVKCWGNTDTDPAYDVVGEGILKNIPTDLVDPVQVSVNWYHACVIDNPDLQPRLQCWGDVDTGNDFGQRLVPAEVNRPLHVAAGRYHTCAINLDDDRVQRLYCWGDPDGIWRTDYPPGAWLGGVVQVTAGEEYTCGRDGTGVQCWGHQTAALPDDIGNPLDVSAGTDRSCAIAGTGENGVRCWGTSNGVITGLIGITMPPARKVATGYQGACAITADERIKCWGISTVADNVPADWK